MVRIVIAALLSAAATGLLIAAILTASPTSGQVLSAVALFLIADLNLLGTVFAESRRRANREMERANAPRPVVRRGAGEEAAERRAATQLLSTIEALAEYQEEAIEGKTAVDVILLATGRNKIAVIKELREGIGGGLRETKKLADQADREPVLIAGNMPVGAAQRLAQRLTAAGARVLLR